MKETNLMILLHQDTQGFKKRLHRPGGSKGKITLRGKKRE